MSTSTPSISTTSSSAPSATTTSLGGSNFPTAYRIIIVTVIAVGLLVIAISSIVIRQRRLRAVREQREDRQRFLMDVRAEYRDLGRRRGPVGWWEFRELEAEAELRPGGNGRVGGLGQGQGLGRTGVPAVWDVGLVTSVSPPDEKKVAEEDDRLPDEMDDWQPIELSFSVTLPPAPPTHTSIIVSPPVDPSSAEPTIHHLSASFLLQLPHEPDPRPISPDETPLPPMELATVTLPVDTANDPDHKVEEMRNEALIFRRPGPEPAAAQRPPTGLPAGLDQYLIVQEGVPSRFIERRDS